MGQYWKLFNLDKLECQEYGGGSIGEFYFSNADNYLVNLLLTGQPGHYFWGGDRIILLGDYAYSLPPDTVVDSDSVVLKEITIAALEGESLNVHEFLDENSSDISYMDVVASDITTTLPDDTVFVLRNLDKKEYVRKDVIRRYRKYDEGNRSRKPGLSQAFYMLVGWSDDSGASMVYGYDESFIPASGGTTVLLHRGQWAGNHIDIVALTDEVEKTFVDEEWLDISEEKARHVSDAYAAEYNGHR